MFSVTAACSSAASATGPPPSAGNSYRLFVAGSYNGAFASQTFPPLGTGLTWADHLLTDGSISVEGGVVFPSPVITSTHYDPLTHQITVTWTSVPSVTYSILSTTNLSSGFSVLATGIPSGGSSTTNTVTLPTASAGFVKIRQP